MIQDETGAACIIPPHAPARELILKLEALGYRWIVLPRHTLLTGEVSRDRILSVEQRLPPRVAPPGTSTIPVSWALLHYRMEDCLGAIESI